MTFPWPAFGRRSFMNYVVLNTRSLRFFHRFRGFPGEGGASRTYPQYFLSRLRRATAWAICSASIISDASRSAIVLAIRITLS